MSDQATVAIAVGAVEEGGTPKPKQGEVSEGYLSPGRGRGLGPIQENHAESLLGIFNFQYLQS